MNQSDTPVILIVMGVSGSGKTTVGKAIAKRLSWPFHDGDDYHPQENVLKMARGEPLNDNDRQPWLVTLRGMIQELIKSRQSAVIACSALKQSYRDILAVDPHVHFVYLKGSYDLFRARLLKRPGHFMPLSLLESQFRTLEEPKKAITVDANLTPEKIAEEVLEVDKIFRRRGEEPW